MDLLEYIETREPAHPAEESARRMLALLRKTPRLWEEIDAALGRDLLSALPARAALSALEDWGSIAPEGAEAAVRMLMESESSRERYRYLVRAKMLREALSPESLEQLTTTKHRFENEEKKP